MHATPSPTIAERMSSGSDSGFTRYRHNPEALSRSVGASLIVSTGHRETLDELSGGAATAWDLLRFPRTFPELVEKLSQLHQIGSPTFTEEIGRMLDDMVERKLVEEVVDFDA